MSFEFSGVDVADLLDTVGTDHVRSHRTASQSDQDGQRGDWRGETLLEEEETDAQENMVSQGHEAVYHLGSSVVIVRDQGCDIDRLYDEAMSRNRLSRLIK